MQLTGIKATHVPYKGGGGGEGDEGIHYIVVPLLQLAAAGRGRAARYGNVRVLGCPQRVETPLFQRDREFCRRDRVVGKEDRGAEFHGL